MIDYDEKHDVLSARTAVQRWTRRVRNEFCMELY